MNAISDTVPVTSVMARRLTRLSENPIACISPKVGSTESGSASEVISVARQSLRKMNTTITARIAPSMRVCMADS